MLSYLCLCEIWHFKLSLLYYKLMTHCPKTDIFAVIIAKHCDPDPIQLLRVGANFSAIKFTNSR